jgi:hypothetical protein
MKYWMGTLALLLGISILAGVGTYRIVHGPTATDPMHWLRTEFSASKEQMQQIESLHQAYRLVCDRHCAEIRALREEIAAMRSQPVPPDALQAAEHKLQELDATCRGSLNTHLDAVAKLLGPEAGPRYLELIQPRIEAFDHEGTPALCPGPECAHDPSNAQ